MKRTAFLTLLLVLVMSVASLAATVTPAKKVTADTTSTTTSSGASLMGLTGVTLTSVGCPAAHFGMGGWSLDVGGTIANAANTTTLTLLARGNIPLSKISNGLSTYWGPAVLYNSAGSGTTTITVLVGAEYVFAPNLSLFADLTAFSLTSANGATTWFAGANAGQIYSGGRLYL